MIRLPNKVTVDSVARVLEACRRIEDDRAQGLDASETSVWGPMGAALVALALTRRREAGLPTLPLILPKDPAVARFLQEIRLDWFVEPVGSPPNQDVFAIRQVTGQEFTYTRQIAELLSEHALAGPVGAHLIETCLNELMTNVYEHAQSAVGCFVLCRYYARDSNVRLAVVDGGRGIPAVLRTAFPARLGAKTDVAVVRAAVAGGLSSRRQRPGGRGLSNIRELFVMPRDGRLTVVSGTAKLFWQGAQDSQEQNLKQKSRDVVCAGTAVEIDFRPLAPGGEAKQEWVL